MLGTERVYYLYLLREGMLEAGSIPADEKAHGYVRAGHKESSHLAMGPSLRRVSHKESSHLAMGPSLRQKIIEVHPGAGSLKGGAAVSGAPGSGTRFHTLREGNGLADKRCSGMDGLRLSPMSGGRRASNRVEPRITSSLIERRSFLLYGKLRKTDQTKEQLWELLRI